MPQDKERVERLRAGIREAGLDAVAATLPENVLLSTGYFPVVGTALALVTRDGEVLLFAPHDEHELAEQGRADALIPFRPASLDRITNASEAIREPLRKALRDKGLERAAIGYESASAYEPASYASMHLYGGALLELFEGAALRPAADLFSRMKAVLTPIEADRVRRSCRVAALAFREGVKRLASGLTETEAAAAFRTPLFTAGVGFEGAHRADGYAFCMAGAHSANASGAYARSRDSRIGPGDLVLTHCNSHTDGYWTDITRTFSLGAPRDRASKIYRAVFEARAAALAAIRPGAKAADVDGAARGVMRAHGFGEQFKHSTGHGIGFSAINHDAPPRLHPASTETLAAGMVFNVEPAAYFEGFGGIRHCDMVLVTDTGAEVLTPFQTRNGGTGPMKTAYPVSEGSLPPMARIRRALPGDHIEDPRRQVRERLLEAGLASQVRHGARIAITAGSRGIGGFVELRRRYRGRREARRGRALHHSRHGQPRWLHGRGTDPHPRTARHR